MDSINWPKKVVHWHIFIFRPAFHFIADGIFFQTFTHFEKHSYIKLNQLTSKYFHRF